MVDFHIYPFFERIPAMVKLNEMSGNDYDPMPAITYPRLTRWVRRIQALPAVQDTILSDDLHMQFEMNGAQREPEYDFGLTTVTPRV